MLGPQHHRWDSTSKEKFKTKKYPSAANNFQPQWLLGEKYFALRIWRNKFTLEGPIDPFLECERRLEPVALRHVHDGPKESFHRPAVEPLPVQRHSLHLAGGGLGVNCIRELNLTTGAGRLAAQDLEDVRRQDITTD